MVDLLIDNCLMVYHGPETTKERGKIEDKAMLLCIFFQILDEHMGIGIAYFLDRDHA